MVATQDNPRIVAAINQIAAFEKRYSTSHVHFASHLAFPLAFTPPLAYKIWQEFGNDINGKSLNIPWIAVADVLLSPLCREIEPELYEMDGAVRTVLLNRLKSDEEKLGLTRIQQLSKFIKNYIKQQLKSRNPQIKETAKIQYWIALAYSEPNQAAKEIALALQQIDWGNKLELIRTSSLIDTFGETLADFQPLLIFARGMAKFGRGDINGTITTLTELGKQAIEIAGVSLQIPQFFSFETVTVDKEGKEINRETKQARYFTENLGNNITLEMVYIPGGTFTMGSPEGEGSDNEKPQHQVTIQSFWMGKYPVTQAQWQAVAALPQIKQKLEPNPSRFKGKNLPVEQISWYDAVEFCDRLSRHTGKTYRLPSEAQWEYACRARTTSPFYFGETITPELANYNGNYTYGSGPKGKYRQETTPVGSFPPNGFGLYDMHGNVWEWCADHWHFNYDEAPNDETIWLSSDIKARLLRGGSWNYLPWDCRSAYRSWVVAGDRLNDFGFRVVCLAAWT